MKILLVNDDGIDAPGLVSLHESVTAAVRLHHQSDTSIIVVAPDRGRSECGHSVTTGRPLVVREPQPNWFSVDGTPVDCVRIALGELARDVDCVISGINAGANLGVDLLVSGTFAAAREAAIQRVPALAVSHYRKPQIPKTWDHAPRWLAPVLRDFLNTAAQSAIPQRESTPLWNVNLPAIDSTIEHLPVRVCPVDTNPMRRVYVPEGDGLASRTDFHGRPRDVGSDVTLCFGGHLTLSKLTPNHW